MFVGGESVKLSYIIIIIIIITRYLVLLLICDTIHNRMTSQGSPIKIRIAYEIFGRIPITLKNVGAYNSFVETNKDIC